MWRVASQNANWHVQQMKQMESSGVGVSLLAASDAGIDARPTREMYFLFVGITIIPLRDSVGVSYSFSANASMRACRGILASKSSVGPNLALF